MKKTLVIALTAIQVVTITGLTVNLAYAGFTQCSDGINNDPGQDSLIDAADPGCHTDFNASNSSSYNPNLNSEINPTSGGGGGGNGTGFTQCSDGINNDPLQDNLIDAADPGCHTDFNANNSSSYNPNLNSEINPSQGGGNGGNYQCNDGTDNDGDGKTDMQDPDCTSTTDNSEFSSCLPNGCNPPPPPPVNHNPVCPVFTAQYPNYTVSVGDNFTLTINASDPDGDSISYSLTQSPAGMTISNSGVIHWTPSGSQAGNVYTVRVRVTDSHGAHCSTSFTIEVRTTPSPPTNHAPICDLFPTSQSLMVGGTASFRVDASDSDQNTVTLSASGVPSGMTFVAASTLAYRIIRDYSWTPSASQTGTWHVNFRVTDSNGAYDDCTATITVNAQQNGGGGNNNTNTNTNTNTNNNTNNNNIYINGGGSGGGSNNDDAECDDGRDNDHDGDIDYPDDEGCRSYNDDSEDSDNNNNDDPECDDNRDNDHDGDVDYPEDRGCRNRSDDSEDSDDNDNDNRYECDDNRDNDRDGYIDYPDDRGCSSRRDDSENSDRGGSRDSAPYFTSYPLTFGVEGQLYFYDANAVDADGDNLSYSLVLFPAGMTIDSNSGVVRWVPNFSQGGTEHPVVIRVTDGRNAAAQPFTIRVQNVGGNPTPTPTPIPTPTPVPTPIPVPTQELRIFNLRANNDGAQNVIITFETNIPATGMVRFGTVSEAEKFDNWTYPYSAQSVTGVSTFHQMNLGPLPIGITHYLRAFASAGSQNAVTAELAFVQLPNGTIGGVNGGPIIVPPPSGNPNGAASALATLGAFIVSPGFLWFLIIVLLIVLLVTALMPPSRRYIASGPVEIRS